MPTNTSYSPSLNWRSNSTRRRVSSITCGVQDPPPFFHQRTPEVAARLAGVVPISPLADLRPLLRTSMNADLRLDMAEAEAESPMLMAERLNVPATVWVGADERPAFLDQARWLAEAWGCAHVVAEGRHHFDVIEPLEIADSDLTGALLG